MKNVVLIGIDTLRADHLGCYGYKRDTSPNIDDLSKKGILFEKCFSQAPITSPSFMSIMTSLYPTYHGITSFIGPAGADGRIYTLDPRIPTLAQVLKENNFQTGAFTDGGQLCKEMGFDRGFDTYSVNPNYFHSEEGNIQEHTVFEWLKKQKNDPFFLFFHSYAAHSPWMTPKSYWNLYGSDSRSHFSIHDFLEDREILNLAQTDLYPHFYRKVNKWVPADIEYVQALYDGGIRYLDTFIGRLLHILSELKADSETIVIVTSDHGEEFLDHGMLTHRQLYDELLHVPLIIRIPGEAEGERVAQLVRSIDIFPTILELLGISFKKPIHGISLADSAKNDLHLASIAETEYLGYSFRNAESKYIFPFYRSSKERFDELYNIQSDPREKKNIAMSELSRVEDMIDLYVRELHRENMLHPRRGIRYVSHPE